MIDLLQIAFRAGRHRTVGDLLGCPAAERERDPAAQVALRIVVPVVNRLVVRGSERQPAWHDCELLHGVRPRDQQAHQRMARLVVGDQPLFVGAQHDRPAKTKHRSLDRLVEILSRHRRPALARRDQRRFVDDVAQVGADEAGGCAGDIAQVHVGSERDVARVDLEDSLASCFVRCGDGHSPVEPTGTEECRIEHLGAIGGGQHDDVLIRGESVHLGQDLVQGLLAFVVRAKRG